MILFYGGLKVDCFDVLKTLTCWVDSQDVTHCQSVHNNFEALLTSEVCYCYLASFSYKEYSQSFTGEK